MMAYRFGIGERVTYSEKRFPTGVWTTELTVVEQLTRDGLPAYDRRLDHGVNCGRATHARRAAGLSPAVPD